ncbi:peptidase [Thermopolyspora flexuosa]|uniref:Alpha/beta hydrolase family protein n=1 Tax=Thermopolyspora flexuosa TaxID=103836 RepID=A0A543J0X9_9ACTN|nr:alpha/beta hydrolase [Thermopolyspora flexuosa]TQM76478.1 alpha/beta hydrolase family protein [Thermopolyspora flexuosa]GGM67828.1 peptidase [Thermopolyspora flexuosa]
MKRVIAVATGATVLATGLGWTAGAEAYGAAGRAAGAGAAPKALRWGACDKVGAGSGERKAECATVEVPLDHSDPSGRRLRLALNRFRATGPRSARLGVLLVNPGGPGASGRELAAYVAAHLPERVTARYDIVGFDPRGVGASSPALSCVDPKRYYRPPRPDNVPRGERDEEVLLERARAYAEGCASRWSWLLPHMTTENAARDMDVIRQALGERTISYLGYSYGTYLGAVYATLFPERVRRMVLDSVIDPTGVWYANNLAQNTAFERRHRDFMAWVAAHHRTYRLGATAERVGAAWYRLRESLRDRPANGVIGPTELDDLFTVAGYTDAIWPKLARAFADQVRRGDATRLMKAFRRYVRNGTADAENGYAVYLAVECRDAPWPRDWAAWRADSRRLNATAPFLTWANTWYNAPCAFWPVPGRTPVKVGTTAKLPPILMLQSRRDAATPYQGALRMRRLFPTARLVTVGGGNHGVTLSGNVCADRRVESYLLTGAVPGERAATCRRAPAPVPGEATRAASVRAARAPIGTPFGL